MKNVFSIICIISMIITPIRVVSQDIFSLPPEWDPQEAVWVDFATEQTFIPNINAKIDIIIALSKYVKTKVVYDNDSLKAALVDRLTAQNAILDSIEYIKTSGPMNWIRDPGPIFISNGKTLKSLDFKWNCYGNAYDCQDDRRGTLDNEVAIQMNIEINTVDLYLEGGGIEVSNNSILAYKAMATQRNPEVEVEKVTRLLLEKLGKDQVIWLDEFPLIDKPRNKITNYFGQGANGHIDVTTRFLNDSTILATVISDEDKNKSPLLAEDYRILQSNLNQLKKARQPSGKPYKIITVEAPDYSLFEYKWEMPKWFWYQLPESEKERFTPGDTIILVPALEYANFLITNGAVLVSKYWKEGMPEMLKQKDQAIQNVLKEYFPNREIIALDVTSINWGGGGIHCRTKQEPKLKPLK